MDKELNNLMQRFEKDNYIIVKDGNLTKNLVKKPKIKTLRKNKQLVVGYDRANKTTIFFKKPLY